MDFQIDRHPSAPQRGDVWSHYWQAGCVVYLSLHGPFAEAQLANWAPRNPVGSALVASLAYDRPTIGYVRFATYPFTSYIVRDPSPLEILAPLYSCSNVCRRPRTGEVFVHTIMQRYYLAVGNCDAAFAGARRVRPGTNGFFGACLSEDARGILDYFIDESHCYIVSGESV